MTLLFIAWGEYPGFEDALACARARSGCEIVVKHYGRIGECGLDPAIPKFMIPNTDSGRFYAVMLWLVLMQAIERGEVALPVFVADWDILFFSDLPSFCATFAKNDFNVTRDCVGDSSAAYNINTMAPLLLYRELLAQARKENHPPIETHHFNDMFMWKAVAQVGRFAVGDMAIPVNGRVIDHNIHDPGGRPGFEMDGPTKKIVFTDGKPHFIQNGQPVEAACIHCWGTFKTKTKWLREQCGI